MITKDRWTQFWWVGIVAGTIIWEALSVLFGKWTKGGMISAVFSMAAMILILSAVHFPDGERPSVREYLRSWKLYAALVLFVVPSMLRIW